MTDKDLWTTFEKTGSVVDYLHYKGIHEQSETQRMGETNVESGSHSDGNDIVRNTYR
ncbi:MAG: hypothetical protein J6J72_04495 [Tyzzerella sp.]|nr:hypothetical protein [Tyzzerella sp.]